MSKKITKKQCEKFVDLFCKGIKEMGGESNINTLKLPGYFVFDLQTRGGLLNIKLPIEHEFCYSVFSMFEDIDSASKLFACNSNSGKYNVHLAPTDTPEKMVEIALSVFRQTLPK